LNKWLVAIAFSVLLLVPVGAQNLAFAGTPDPDCLAQCENALQQCVAAGVLSPLICSAIRGECNARCPLLPPTEICGDGVVNQAIEQCDPAPAGSLPTVTCNANCQNIPFCGDGAINQLTEQCEDPNLPTATCDINCQIIVPPPPVCGDGDVNQATEQCDPAPAGSLPTATCDIDCQNIVAPPTFSCGLGTTPNVITNECDPDVTQAQLDIAESLRDAALAALAEAQAQRDAILATLFEFLRVFGVI